MKKIPFIILMFALVVAIWPSIEAARVPRQQNEELFDEFDDLEEFEEEIVMASDREDDGNSTLFDGAKNRCGTGTCCTPTPPSNTNPTYPSVTYATNCDFCDHDLYTLTCVSSAFACAARCAVDARCTHFTYIANLNGGTCRLKSAPGSGGAWASVIPPPSAYTCGYISKRAYTSILLGLCLGLDIGITGIISI